MADEDKYEDRHTVKILGEEMTITGALSEDYVEELVAYVNQIGNEIVEAYPHLPRRRLMGLTLINIVHQYFKSEKKNKELSQEKEKLKQKNKQLKNEIKKLQEEYEELSVLLEEVDG